MSRPVIEDPWREVSTRLMLALLLLAVVVTACALAISIGVDAGPGFRG